ncbi:MAG TPA: NUDIX domain-containing protein, partial [Bryobacteraceae bacterium]|nr:NUDIX domain-containing protein [Bryobacteraceae bacterium]
GERMPTSAGLLMYRVRPGGPEVLLVHPGGPFFANKDAGAWTIPKGMPDEGEDLLDCAKREFREETGFDPGAGPFLPLGTVKQKGGKTVHAWAFEGDCNPAEITSNTLKVQWPPRSGKWITVPEVDRAAFFPLDIARAKINAAQQELLGRVEGAIIR